MPRDYKNSRSNAQRKSGSRSQVRVFLTGFVAGIALTAAVFAAERFNLIAFGSQDSGRPTPRVVFDQGSTQETEKPHFEFYTMLPEMEVAVKEEEFQLPAVAVQTTSEPAVEPLKGVYLLQAGSFRRHEDADALKASLALLGLEAAIQTVSINGKETWHRVRLGPFTERDALNNARDRLAEHDLEAMVLKKRP